MKIEDYLYKNFDHVEKLTNGGYYAYNNGSNTDSLYIPNNQSGNVDLLSYLPGSTGSTSDARKFVEQIYSANPPEYAISIAGTFKDENMTMEKTYQALSNSGYNVDNVIEMTFSASGKRGFSRLDEFLGKHPDVNCALVKVQGVTPETTNFPNLIKDKTPVVVINATDAYYVFTDEARTFTNGGINYFWLQSDSGAHKYHNSDLISNHFIDYLFGYTNSFGNYAEGNSNGANYRLVKYDNGSHGIVYANYDDIIIGDGSISATIPNLSRLNQYDEFTITEQSVKQTENMGILNNLKEIKLISKDNNLTSKYSYVEASVNDFRNAIKSSSYLTGLKEGQYRSTEGIPGIISPVIKSYFDTVSNLLTNISLESESMLSYAQALIDMDNDMAQEASELGQIVGLTADNKLETSYLKDEDKTELIYGNDDKETNDKTDSTQDQHNYSGHYKPSEKKYEFEDGHKAIFTQLGNQITEFKYQYEFKTIEEINKNYLFFSEIYKDNPIIDRIEILDNSIEIIFNKEELKKLSIEEIKSKYLADAKELIKA